MTTDQTKQRENIPRLSSNDIELKAEEVIKFFCEQVLSSAQPTPALEFVQITKSRFGIDFRDDLDLGQGSSGGKILGQFRINPKGIFVDVSLKGSVRIPFVLAHEFGHLVLHRCIDPAKSGYSSSSIDDTELDFVTGKKILRTPRDWVEWQANRFASALLMPRATFSDALMSYQKAKGIKRNIGIVYVDSTRPSLRDLNVTLGHLATVYGVNQTNVECRLRDLELLQDHRYKSTRHISELLMEK